LKIDLSFPKSLEPRVVIMRMRDLIDASNPMEVKQGALERLFEKVMTNEGKTIKKLFPQVDSVNLSELVNLEGCLENQRTNLLSDDDLNVHISMHRPASLLVKQLCAFVI